MKLTRKHVLQTSSGCSFVNPNLPVHIDSASSAAGRTNLFTFNDPSKPSIQENRDWK